MSKQPARWGAILAAAAVLAACGGGSGGGGGGAGSAASGATTTATPLPGSVIAAPVGAPGSMVALPAGSPAPAGARATILGVNIHEGGGTASANAQVASILATRNLQHVRMDYGWQADVAQLRDQVARITGNGGTVQLVLQNSYQWDTSCPQGLAAVEQDSYTQAVRMVAAMKDLVRDYEILNEIPLRPDVAGQVAWNSQGSATGAYTASPCAQTLAAVGRGIARAVHEQGQRVILGAVGRDWGFLTFMRQQGVAWDVTGWHVYPSEDDASLLSDPWWGAGGPLAQLAAFGKPVTINEFNCGEIYDAGYENRAGAPLTEACLRSIHRHLGELRNQTLVQLESVVAYELFDEPSKAAPENRFGLMATPTSAKPALYLYTAYAGGSLAAAEQQALTSRGLLSDAQIAAMR